MSKLFSEIKARHDSGSRGLRPHQAHMQAHDDRTYLLDLVQRLRDCLFEFSVCTPALDDERLRYVEIQVTREELEQARALVKEIDG